MSRTAASIAPDAIRIEEEVWQEAFDQRVPRPRRPRPAPAPAPSRRAAPTGRRGPLPAGSETPVPATRPGHEPDSAPVDVAGPDLRLVPAPARPFDFAAEGDEPGPPATVTPASTPAATTSTGAPARRTVTIKGRGAERNLPWESGIAPRRSTRLPHHRSTFRPDRLAMWAMLLGLLLVLVAAISAH